MKSAKDLMYNEGGTICSEKPSREKYLAPKASGVDLACTMSVMVSILGA